MLSFTEPVTKLETLNEESKTNNKENSITDNSGKSSHKIETSPPHSPSVEEIDESMYQVDDTSSPVGANNLSIESNNNRKRDSYAPKCIVLISKHQDFQVLKVD